MANKFVWSGATGLNDGSSWDNAYTSLFRDWGAEAGFTPGTDFVYVRSIHDETQSTSQTLTGSTGEGTTPAVRIISVVGAATGTDPGALANGATCRTSGTTSDIFIQEKLYINGVNFLSSDDIFLGSTALDHFISLEDVRLELTGISGADQINMGQVSNIANFVIGVNVTFDFAAAAQGVTLDQGTFLFRGGSLAFNVTNFVETANFRPVHAVFEAMDLSVLTGNLVNITNLTTDSTIVFSRCVLGTGASITTGTIDTPYSRVESFHCQIGTDADPAFQLETQAYEGSVKTDTSRYRTGGASDGVRTNPISWDLNTNVGSHRNYPGNALVSPPITGWTPGDGVASHTYRIYFASDATINDDEIWFELIGPNDTATDSKGALKTNRVAPRTTAAARTTDGTSTWTGTGVNIKQQMDIVYTPDKPGPIIAKVYMAKASDNIYVDPQIVIDP